MAFFSIIKTVLIRLIAAWTVLAVADQLLPDGENGGRVGAAAKKVVLLALLCSAAEGLLGR